MVDETKHVLLSTFHALHICLTERERVRKDKEGTRVGIQCKYQFKDQQILGIFMPYF